MMNRPLTDFDMQKFETTTDGTALHSFCSVENMKDLCWKYPP